MNNFTPFSALLGGVIIGLSVVFYFYMTGRLAGISGIFENAITKASQRLSNLACIPQLQEIMLVDSCAIILPKHHIQGFSWLFWERVNPQFGKKSSREIIKIGKKRIGKTGILRKKFHMINQ